MLKWIPNPEREPAREQQKAKREWESEEQEAERARVRMEHEEKIMAEVLLKAECDRWDQHMRNLQNHKRRKSLCWSLKWFRNAVRS